MILHALEHAFLDTIRMVPFLLAAFLALEALEHYSNNYMNRILGKVGKAGPVVGALFGCVPQCGFSVAAANLYSGGVITLGTLLAVFLSTSDEAVLILLGNPGSGGSHCAAFDREGAHRNSVWLFDGPDSEKEKGRKTH